MNSVTYIDVDSELVGQRLDNYLLTRLKGVPKGRIYRIIRKGEVRINGKRIKANYKLQLADRLRLPPIRVAEREQIDLSHLTRHLPLDKATIYEDNNILVINKPAGLSVHGGSGIHVGVIELLRQQRSDISYIELAHRLDKDTSGCLLLAKKRRILKELHALLREGKVTKRYHALVLGQWSKQKISSSLAKNVKRSGERMVTVAESGKEALTYFKPLEMFIMATLIEAIPHTGRTHQIRVHAAASGHPIAGDKKYGDKAFNRLMRSYGLKRMFLHAAFLEFELPSTATTIAVSAPLEPQLQQVLQKVKIICQGHRN